MLLKIFAYAALGLVLLLLNVWYIRGIRRNFLAEDFLIAPFQVIGEKGGDSRGQALAHMLVARLSEIEREMTAVNDALTGDLPESGQGSSLLQDRPADYTVSLPSKIFKPLNLDVSVGGIELKGVLSWFQLLFAQNRMLQLSVEGGDKSARIGGSWNFRGINPVWIELNAEGEKDTITDGEIVDAVAYALAFQAFEKRTPAVGALTAPEFRKLFYALVELAKLNRRVALGRPAENEYREFLDQIEPLAKKANTWSDLVRLAAQLAERADDLERALDLYQGEARRLAAGEQPVPDELRAKIDSLNEDITADLRAKFAARREPAAAADQLAAAPEKPLESIYRLTGVESTKMSARPIIAIPGVAPSAVALRGAEIQVLNGGGEGQGYMSEYTTSVISAVRIIAPEARFLVSEIPGAEESGGAFSPSALAEAVFALQDEAYDLLLFPYGPVDFATFGPIFSDVVQHGAAIVLAAGNNQGQPAPTLGPELQPSVLVSAAVDLDGKQAPFTQFGEGSVWAPGVEIPVRLGGARGSDRRSGTTYSAAITAGIAARVLAEYPDLQPHQLVDLLRRTAKAGAGGRPILSYSAALSALRERASSPGA